jgi:hypothetical protein
MAARNRIFGHDGFTSRLDCCPSAHSRFISCSVNDIDRLTQIAADLLHRASQQRRAKPNDILRRELNAQCRPKRAAAERTQILVEVAHPRRQASASMPAASARAAAPHLNVPRVPSLEALGRRPLALVASSRMGPSSKTLHNRRPESKKTFAVGSSSEFDTSYAPSPRR